MGYPSLIVYQRFGLVSTVCCRFHSFLFIKLVYENDATQKAGGKLNWKVKTNRANSKAFESGTVKNLHNLSHGSTKVLHEVRPIRQYHEDIKI